MVVKSVGVLIGLFFLLQNITAQRCPTCGKCRAILDEQNPAFANILNQVAVRPKILGKPLYKLPLLGSPYKGPCFRRTAIVKPATVPRPIYQPPNSKIQIGTNDSELAEAAAAAAKLLKQLSFCKLHETAPVHLGPDHQTIDISKVHQQALAGANSVFPADAVTLTLAYKKYQDSIKHKVPEEGLFYGFKKLPLEGQEPGKVPVLHILEAPLYNLNGSVVELKPALEQLDTNSLSEEALDELVDLTRSEEIDHANFAHNPSLFELGYTPAKISSATLVDVPPVVVSSATATTYPPPVIPEFPDISTLPLAPGTPDILKPPVTPVQPPESPSFLKRVNYTADDFDVRSISDSDTPSGYPPLLPEPVVPPLDPTVLEPVEPPVDPALPDTQDNLEPPVSPEQLPESPRVKPSFLKEDTEDDFNIGSISDSDIPPDVPPVLPEPVVPPLDPTELEPVEPPVDPALPDTPDNLEPLVTPEQPPESSRLKPSFLKEDNDTENDFNIGSISDSDIPPDDPPVWPEPAVPSVDPTELEPVEPPVDPALPDTPDNLEPLVTPEQPPESPRVEPSFLKRVHYTADDFDIKPISHSHTPPAVPPVLPEPALPPVDPTVSEPIETPVDPDFLESTVTPIQPPESPKNLKPSFFERINYTADDFNIRSLSDSDTPPGVPPVLPEPTMPPKSAEPVVGPALPEPAEPLLPKFPELTETTIPPVDLVPSRDPIPIVPIEFPDSIVGINPSIPPVDLAPPLEPIPIVPIKLPDSTVGGIKPGNVIYKDIPNSEVQKDASFPDPTCDSQEEVVTEIPIIISPCGDNLDKSLKGIRTYSKPI